MNVFKLTNADYDTAIIVNVDMIESIEQCEFGCMLRTQSGAEIKVKEQFEDFDDAFKEL